jgi:predicted enzyme related to lactoylglutathione lyase
MEERHHAISYIEIPVTDLARATAFYGTAFGWGFTMYGDAYAGIRAVADDPSREVGGMAVAPKAGGGSPFVLLYSQDLEASLGAVRAAGGTIAKEPYAYPGGRRFHFRDTEGNELGVYTHAK